ncbi:hypothetical protein B4107_1550 [Bacillus safensis]|nr:hypothetical protein B4107_1550 [Bacillus safensis]
MMKKASFFDHVNHPYLHWIDITYSNCRLEAGSLILTS